MFVVGGTYKGCHGVVASATDNFLWLNFTYPLNMEGEWVYISN